MKHILKNIKNGILLSISSLFIFILFFEVVLNLINFDYYPMDIGFNITEDYKMFEIKDNYYVTKEEKIDFIFRAQKIIVEKPENEFRIFIFGGSSIYNLDDFNNLKNKLQKTNDNKKIKIINVGARAYGTDRLLLHFQEILGYEPDLIIIYSGHNEFSEEYQKTIFFQDTFSSRANNKLIEISRLYQLLSLVINKVTKFVLVSNIKSIEESRHPLFPPNAKIVWGITFNKTNIYRNYENNIIKMIKLAKNNNIDIIISTVAYNRMRYPFNTPDNSYELCEEFLTSKRFSEALDCLSKALDSDLQPHRASETSNKIIKKVSRRYKIPLADVDKEIVKVSKYNIPGFDLFDDHCHLNYKGNYVLQTVFYKTVIDNELLS